MRSPARVLVLVVVTLALGCAGDDAGTVKSCYSTASGLVCVDVAASQIGRALDANGDGTSDPFFCASSQEDELQAEDDDRDHDGQLDAADDDRDGDGTANQADDDDDDDGVEDKDECDACNRGPGEAGDFRWELRGDEWQLERGRVQAVSGTTVTVLSPFVISAGGSSSATLALSAVGASVEGPLAAGAEIAARGKVAADGTLHADEIRVLCPR